VQPALGHDLQNRRALHVPSVAALATWKRVTLGTSQYGLALCPADLAPQQRLQYLDQPIGDGLEIAATPLATYEGDLVDFSLLNGGAGLLLVGGDARADGITSPRIRCVFVRRHAAVVSARPSLRLEPPRNKGEGTPNNGCVNLKPPGLAAAKAKGRFGL
jgi:hypothetical protein